MGHLGFDQEVAQSRQNEALQGVVLPMVSLGAQPELVAHKLKQLVEDHVQFEEKLGASPNDCVGLLLERTFWPDILLVNLELSNIQNEFALELIEQGLRTTLIIAASA